MARLAAVGGLVVGADLHFQNVEARPEARLEQPVQDLAALGLLVREQEGRGGAATADPTYAIEDTAGAVLSKIERDFCCKSNNPPKLKWLKNQHYLSFVTRFMPLGKDIVTK